MVCRRAQMAFVYLNADGGDSMKKAFTAMVFLVVFLLGACLSMFAQDYIAPPVRANSNPTRWEHTCFAVRAMSPSDYAAKATELANKAGANGFEAAFTGGSDNEIVCMKRPL